MSDDATPDERTCPTCGGLRKLKRSGWVCKPCSRADLWARELRIATLEAVVSAAALQRAALRAWADTRGEVDPDGRADLWERYLRLSGKLDEALDRHAAAVESAAGTDSDPAPPKTTDET